jgi:hypothetical protein
VTRLELSDLHLGPGVEAALRSWRDRPNALRWVVSAQLNRDGMLIAGPRS